MLAAGAMQGPQILLVRSGTGRVFTRNPLQPGADASVVHREALLKKGGEFSFCIRHPCSFMLAVPLYSISSHFGR